MSNWLRIGGATTQFRSCVRNLCCAVPRHESHVEISGGQRRKEKMSKTLGVLNEGVQLAKGISSIFFKYRNFVGGARISADIAKKKGVFMVIS